MKVRLEIINDDGTKKASAEFEYADRHGLLAFLDIYADETRTTTEPSSISSNSQVNAIEQNTCQSQYVQQQAPINSQQLVQQTQVRQAPVQRVMPQQLPPQLPPQYSQLPVQAPALPQTQQQIQQFGQINMQNPGPVFNPNPIPDHNLSPQYIQPNLPPVGVQQYGYGQPAQPMNPNQQAQPVVPPIVAPVQSVPQQVQTQRKVPSLHTRMNDTSLTISERLEFFLKYEYPRIWFSSQDIQKQYERIYGEIKQSTVSTYLSRMFRKNLLARRGNRTQREYRYIADEVESEADVQIGQMPEMQLDYRFQY